MHAQHAQHIAQLEREGKVPKGTLAAWLAHTEREPDELQPRVGKMSGEMKAALSYEKELGSGTEEERAGKVVNHLDERPQYYVELERYMDPDNAPEFRRALTPGDLRKAAGGMHKYKARRGGPGHYEYDYGDGKGFQAGPGGESEHKAGKPPPSGKPPDGSVGPTKLPKKKSIGERLRGTAGKVGNKAAEIAGLRDKKGGAVEAVRKKLIAGGATEAEADKAMGDDSATDQLRQKLRAKLRGDDKPGEKRGPKTEQDAALERGKGLEGRTFRQEIEKKAQDEHNRDKAGKAAEGT